MACFLPLISQAFPFSAGLHDTQKSVTRWSHTLVRILSLATFDCSSCCRSWPPALPFPPLISVTCEPQHTAEQLHLPVCLPKIRVHLHPLAPSVIFIPGLSSHPCLLSSHLCLNICSPPQITGFYRVPPCIQKCLHNAPVMGTSPSMAGWPRRSTSMWHTLFKQMAQSQPHLLERYNS